MPFSYWDVPHLQPSFTYGLVHYQLARVHIGLAGWLAGLYPLQILSSVSLASFVRHTVVQVKVNKTLSHCLRTGKSTKLSSAEL